MFFHFDFSFHFIAKMLRAHLFLMFQMLHLISKKSIKPSALKLYEWSPLATTGQRADVQNKKLGIDPSSTTLWTKKSVPYNLRNRATGCNGQAICIAACAVYLRKQGCILCILCPVMSLVDNQALVEQKSPHLDGWLRVEQNFKLKDFILTKTSLLTGVTDTVSLGNLWNVEMLQHLSSFAIQTNLGWILRAFLALQRTAHIWIATQSEEFWRQLMSSIILASAQLKCRFLAFQRF